MNPLRAKGSCFHLMLIHLDASCHGIVKRRNWGMAVCTYIPFLSLSGLLSVRFLLC